MIDHVEIIVKAGDGGDGRMSFLRLKFIPKGGPDGGDGGAGGSVFFVGDKNLNTLRSFRGTRRYEATPGAVGGKNNRHGKDGEDLFVKVPLGTVVAHEGNVIAEILHDAQEVRISKGGKGGKGNAFFKGSTNTTPTYAEPGQKIEALELELELKVLANVGFVGFPNAGKSTLLSVLTNAKPQIADYPFTTLTPNLGVMIDGTGSETRSLVLADIPGLIEGASQGKGLGLDFLRHVERCEVLLYVLSLEEIVLGDEELSAEKKAISLFSQYKALKKELEEFDLGMNLKKVLIGVNKIDLYRAEVIEAIEKLWKKKGFEVVLFSAATTKGIEKLRQRLFELVQGK